MIVRFPRGLRGVLRIVLPALLSWRGGAFAQEPPADVTFVQVEGQRVTDAVYQDLDGDGRRDLIIATGELDAGVGPSRRWLRIHLQREAEPPFLPAPDRVLEVVRDVAAFAVADVHPHPGREIVLLSASLAVGAYWADDGDARPALFRIAPVELLWQPPSWPRTIEIQEAVVDLDGDGRDDLLLPEPGGYRAVLQRPAEDGTPGFATARLSLPARQITDREEGQARLKAQADTLRMRLREDEAERVFTLLECQDSVPAPAVVDWEGDGDMDVVALVENELCVWLYAAAFAEEPELRYTLPPFQTSILNPSNFVRVADLDGDRRCDVVFVAGRVHEDEVQGVLEVYLQNTDGTVADTPADRLLLQGFVSVPRIEDIDGDGLPELVIGSLRPDLIGTISAGGSGSIDGQVNVFRNGFGEAGGRFGRPAAMVEKLPLSSQVLRSRFRDRVIASFFHDLDGDGVRDFLQRTQPERLIVRTAVSEGQRIRLGDVVWEMPVADDARVLPIAGPDEVALVIVEGSQVVHAKLR